MLWIYTVTNMKKIEINCDGTAVLIKHGNDSASNPLTDLLVSQVFG